MRKLGTVAAVFFTLSLAACGGTKSSSSTSKTPKGCPAETTLNINAPTGAIAVPAATRKAVVRSNFLSVYLFSRTLNQSDADIAKIIGSDYRIDGEGAIIVTAKNADYKAAPTTGEYVVDPKAPLQIVGYSIQSNNKRLTALPGKPAPGTTMTITAMTDTMVCGTISGAEGSTTFSADRINPA